MARKLPKHVKPTGSTLGYQRAIPTKLRHISPIKNWTYPLGVPATASDSEIAAAWAKANEAFELHCKTLTNSSPAAYAETEVERLAEDFLRRKSLSWGRFSDERGYSGKAVNALIKATNKRFPTLELFSGWGLFAQNLEGQILKDVLLEGVKKDIVCLPVHDAVAVQQQHIDWAKEQMVESWNKITGTRGLSRVKVDTAG